MDEADPVNVSDFQEIARKMLPKMYYDFFRGGAEGEFSLKENIKAFERILFRPRVLVDVRNINMSTNLLGYDIHSPILIAPTGSQKLAHPEGEVATARAAAACKALMVLSFSSSCTLEEVASCCDAVRFFQLYVFKNRDITERIVKRAECSGFKAIVLTVDTPRLGKREKDIKNKMIVPKVANYELLSADVSTNNGSGLEAFTYQNFDPSLTWQDVEWLKSKTTLPILLKGILTTDDARMAIKTGISGIIVSNHGARQLDYSPAPISVLEEIVKTVSGAIPVLMDGGIRRGTDVFKALALGANAVLVGRPVVFGLAANGEKGVQKVIQMLNDELELTMALAGCPTIKHISRNCVQTVGDKLRSSM